MLNLDVLYSHAELQKKLNTPICLDECIHDLEHARAAVALGACKIINIKLGRVGGHTMVRRIHDLCEKNSIPVWCGGMLESGIGRAHNIALSTLPNFTLPGDVSASTRVRVGVMVVRAAIAYEGLRSRGVASDSILSVLTADTGIDLCSAPSS